MNIIKLLKSKGLRAGKVRVDFLQYLLDVCKPISAVDILQNDSMQSVSKSSEDRNIVWMDAMLRCVGA